MREKGPEDDKDDDEGCRYAKREAEDSLGGEIHVLYYPAQRIPPDLKYSRNIISEITVSEEDY